MAYPVSLLQLRTRVREAADIQNATARFPDCEVNDKINRAITRWYDLIVATPWGGSTYYSTYTFTTTSGQSAYGLPPDWLHIDSIDINTTPGTGNNIVRCAVPYQVEDRNAFQNWNVSWSYTRPVYYRVLGQNLNFLPKPPGNYSISLNYIPVAPQFVGGVTSVYVSGSGSGYTGTPTVSFIGGGSGSGATATATVSGGAVISVNMTGAGSGYNSAPVVAFAGGSGAGATGSATLLYDDTLTLDCINGWDEALVTRAAVMCLTKDGEAEAAALQILNGQLMDEESRIRTAAGVRDRNRAEVVHDVTSDLDPYDW